LSISGGSSICPAWQLKNAEPEVGKKGYVEKKYKDGYVFCPFDLQ